MTQGEVIRHALDVVCEEIKIGKDVEFTVEPTDLSHGDYATNIALVLGKSQKRNPKDLAGEIVLALKKKKYVWLKKAEVAGPGFINLWLTEETLTQAISIGEDVGWNESLKGKKYIVEYTDPNPFKEFHIGHLMSNTIGESISRLVEASGAETKRACYQGDVGLHVAKAIWDVLKRRNVLSIPSPDGNLRWEKIIIDYPFEFELNGNYANGHKAYEEGGSVREEILKINKEIYAQEDTLSVHAWYKGKEKSLLEFARVYKKLGTTFDHYFFESETGTFGKEIVEKNIGNVFEKSEGAVVYKGDESKGLHTRVFINKEGLPTYEAKELGLAKIKYDAYPYDHSIVVTASEVNDYFRVLLDAMSKVFPELAAKTEHIGHGMMRLPSGKMSSRTGDVITAESMIEDVQKRVEEKMKESPVPEGDRSRIAEQVAIGAIKYSILRQAPGKDIIFDLESALSFEGDSGPYLQYAHARTAQLLEKGKAKGLTPTISDVEHGELSRFLARFPDVVLRAQEERAPQYVATYLIDLARAFNAFYAEHIIVDETKRDISSGRLALTQAVGRTLASGLWMLGISAPDMM